MGNIVLDFFQKNLMGFKKNPPTTAPMAQTPQPTKETKRRIRLNKPRSFVCLGANFMVQPGEYTIDSVVDENTSKVYVVFVNMDAPGDVGAEASEWEMLFKNGVVKFV